MTRRTLAAWIAFAIGLAVFADGLWRSPLVNPAERDRRAWLAELAQADRIDAAEEARLAELYWSRYPDIASNSQYGRTGRLGVRGAREHFRIHGEKEGRAWGP